jgi:hypothetical protein
MLLSPLVGAAADVPLVVSGKVLEKGTRLPLVGANVFILGHDEFVTTTDNEGRFEIRIAQPGRYSINAVAMGHDKGQAQSFDLAVDNTPAEITLYLKNIVVLPDVVIKAERLSDRVAKTTISGSDLESVAGSAGDPLRALQALPGIMVNSDFSADPAIRGSRPGDNLYYADFLPIPYLFHIGGAVSVFPADLIDDFNLYAAAFGPEYGDGIGAVVDVSLRRPRQDRLGGKFNISFINADFLLEGPTADNQSFLFSARRSYLDLVIDEVEDEEEGETFEIPEYSDYLGKYVWDVDDNNRLSFYLTGAGDTLGFSISPDSDTAQKEPVLAGTSASETVYHNQAMLWDRRISSRANNKLAISYSQSQRDAVIGTAADQQIRTNSVYLRELLRLRPNSDHELFIGAMLRDFSIDLDIDSVNPLCTDLEPDCDLSGAPRLQLDDRFSVNSLNLSLKDRWRATPALYLIGGLHYSYEDYLDKRYLEPRLGLEWQLSDKTLFTAGWGQYNQFPEGGQVVEDFGNPELDHLRSEHSVLGLAHALDKVWLIKGELYYKTFDDLVVSDPVTNYTNGASGTAYGLELLIKRDKSQDYSQPLSGWLALSLSEAERRIDSNGDRFPFNYDQPLHATLVLNYRASARWSYGLSWRYHSGAPYTPVTGSQTVTDPDGSTRLRPVYGETNATRLPSYHRLDLRVDRDFVYDRFLVNAYLEIANVYNRKNISGYRYPPDYDPGKKKANYQLPLIISFGVQFTF